jgi:1,4-dihydroxy-2-naphthoyl-CoA hydrolase
VRHLCCIDVQTFAFDDGVNLDGEEAARGLTRHLAIKATNRQRCPLPEPIQRWLEAASLGAGVQPL